MSAKLLSLPIEYERIGHNEVIGQIEAMRCTCYNRRVVVFGPAAQHVACCHCKVHLADEDPYER